MFRLPAQDWLRSFKHFVRELVTIIAGILIALAFDGMADRHEERKLAREAVANMQSELRDNLHDLEGTRKAYPRMRKQLEENLAALHQLQRGEKVKEYNTRMSLSTVGFTASSLATAEATGALRHMDYAEARRYADVFNVQQEFMHHQDRLVDHWITTTPVGEENLFTLSPDERTTRAAQLTLALRYLAKLDAFAASLAQMYQARLPAPK